MQPSAPMVICGRLKVEIEEVDADGHFTQGIDQYVAAGEAPFGHERWHYAGIRGRGQHWALVLTDLNPPTKLLLGPNTGTFSHEPIRAVITVVRPPSLHAFPSVDRASASSPSCVAIAPYRRPLLTK
eukprot:m.161120 g.161120  ORF g.161120 m.161120 type:complete len:127 (-) comp23824_c0_seq1:81-461(-)